MALVSLFTMVLLSKGNLAPTVFMYPHPSPPPSRKEQHGEPKHNKQEEKTKIKQDKIRQVKEIMHLQSPPSGFSLFKCNVGICQSIYFECIDAFYFSLRHPDIVLGESQMHMKEKVSISNLLIITDV